MGNLHMGTSNQEPLPEDFLEILRVIASQFLENLEENFPLYHILV